MKDYFKVVEESQRLLNEFADLNGEELADIFSPILDEFNKIAELSRWIPVGERLPEEFKSVLALSKSGIVYMAFFVDREKDRWQSDWNLQNIEKRHDEPSTETTHWQPRPELPKAE